MSGGSMNYMFTAGEFGDLERLWSDEDMDNLDKCVDIVQKAVNSSAGTATEVCAAIDKGLEFQKAVELVKQSREAVLNFATEYKDLLYACEWYDSGDWSIEHVRDALFRMRTEAMRKDGKLRIVESTSVG